MKPSGKIRSSGLLLALVIIGSIGCSTVAQQTKTSMGATCASSCKNVSPYSQADCIAQCSK